MKNAKKTIVAGSLIAGAIFGAANLNAASSDMFRFNDLGSGSTVRAKLLNQSETNIRAFLLELNCGEDTKKAPADTKNAPDTKNADGKSTEAKCGEGKCGEGDTKNMKAGATTDTISSEKEGKSSEAKCGEGKCGEE